MQTIKNINIKNKKVIIRVDYNVPIQNGKITDNNRIIASLETINYCINNNAKIILMSHLGKIKTEEDIKNNTLLPVKEELEKLLNKKTTRKRTRRKSKQLKRTRYITLRKHKTLRLSKQIRK